MVSLGDSREVRVIYGAVSLPRICCRSTDEELKGRERRMADQPDLNTIAGSFAGLQSAFRPDKATGVDKTIQFNFTGREAGTWTLIVRNGAVEYHEGAADAPSTTVTVDSDDWLKILRRELDATMAFMGGKLKIAGDMAVMLQFQGWFDQPR